MILFSQIEGLSKIFFLPIKVRRHIHHPPILHLCDYIGYNREITYLAGCSEVIIFIGQIYIIMFVYYTLIYEEIYICCLLFQCA